MPNPAVAYVGMAAVSAASSYSSASKQARAAENAANLQAEGVRQAQEEQRLASQAALPYILGRTPDDLASLEGTNRPLYNPPQYRQNTVNVGGRVMTGVGDNQDEIDAYEAQYARDVAAWEAANTFHNTGTQSPAQSTGDQTGQMVGDVMLFPDQSTGETATPTTDEQNAQATTFNEMMRLGYEPSIATLFGGGTAAINMLGQSTEDQLGVANQAFTEANQMLSPIAGQSYAYQQEQADLLGLNGPEAQAAAQSRVSDPLVAEQERALLRNNAALGGSSAGGNVLSALAEQTRNRTTANVGQRLGQLASAQSPALNALQQMSQNRLGQGEVATGIMGTGTTNQANMLAQLAQQIAGAQQQGGLAVGNTILGVGSNLSQLAQNLGTAQAGAPAFRASQVSPLTQGINSGLSTYLSMGGNFGMQQPSQNMTMNVQDPNMYGGYA